MDSHCDKNALAIWPPCSCTVYSPAMHSTLVIGWKQTTISLRQCSCAKWQNSITKLLYVQTVPRLYYNNNYVHHRPIQHHLKRRRRRAYAHILYCPPCQPLVHSYLYDNNNNNNNKMSYYLQGWRNEVCDLISCNQSYGIVLNPVIRLTIPLQINLWEKSSCLRR